VSITSSTLKTYTNLQNIYFRFREVIQATDPINEEQLCMIIIQFVHSYKLTTLDSFITAIQHYYNLNSLGTLPKGSKFLAVRKGLVNVFSSSEYAKPKQPITLKHLNIIYKCMDFSLFNHCRDWCAYIFAFFGLLRLSEFTEGSLLFNHVTINHNQSLIYITIPFSKTSNNPVTIKLNPRRDNLCPIKAYLNYINHIHPKLHLPNSAFFRKSSNTTGPLRSHSFALTLKSHIVQWLQVDPSQFATHSFRRGGATYLYEIGTPEATIQAHGRWVSLVSRHYYDYSASDQSHFHNNTNNDNNNNKSKKKQ
jgi:hypothetical protein